MLLAGEKLRNLAHRHWSSSTMEKFTKWADKGTHVNPFLPPRTSSKGGLAGRLVSGLFGATLLLIRLPFLVLAIVLLEVAALATFPPLWLALGGGLYCASERGLGPYQKASGAVVAAGLTLWLLAPLRRLVGVLLLRPAVRFLLLVLGVSYVEQHANLRMLGLRPPGYKVPTTAIGATVQAGDLLVSNHTSLLDVLYLASRFLPLFTTFTPVGGGGAKQPSQGGGVSSFQGLGLLGALWRASQVPTIPTTPPPQPSSSTSKGGSSSSSGLLEVMKRAKSEGRAVSVFPELARSNGEAVLTFVDGVFADLDGSEEPVRTHLLGFSSGEAGSSSVMTCHTVGRPIWFLLHLLTKARRTVIKMTYVSAEDTPVLTLKKDGSKTSIIASLTKKSTGAWSEELRTLLAQVVSSKKLKVSLGYRDFVTFNAYWWAVQKGDSETADRLAGARGKI